MPWEMMVDSSATTGASGGQRRADLGRHVQRRVAEGIGWLLNQS
jgi:hypothetical protein